MANAPAVLDTELRMSYKIGRGETGVLSFEPYKSFLLPKWRFRTPSIAAESSETLFEQFQQYDALGDFVGMDMTRKFLQMVLKFRLDFRVRILNAQQGMTRAKRYANYKGGRKYGNSKEGKVEREKSRDHQDHAGKLEACRIFKMAWQKCREHSGYQEKKARFVEEQKAYEKRRREAAFNDQ